ncbi:L-rhamnono-gamma-lactonase [Microsporum canis]
MAIPIIDSHVHLWAASHIDTLAWHSPSNPLGSQHSVEEYLDAVPASITAPVSPSPAQYRLKGFIYIETDRITSLASKGWTHVLEEVSFLTRIASGTPLEREGHVYSDKELCLAIVPWAPVPLGPGGLELYMNKVKERVGKGGEPVWEKIKGVRYLLQDKPNGTMLGEDFIQGLRWLGRRGLTFDLGVDARRGGLRQLEETAELAKILYQQGDQVKLILSKSSAFAPTLTTTLQCHGWLKRRIDHMCKPNLRISPSETCSHPEFMEWKGHIVSLSAYPNIYMKLSGLFSELPPLPAQVAEETDLISSTVDTIQPWTDVIFDTFGTARVMFGSDWPVCNIGGGGNMATWTRWMKAVELLLQKRGINDDCKKDVWYLTAQRAYGISTTP